MTVAAELKAVSKTFGKVRALDTMSLEISSLEISAGEIVAILRPNGAGKTTAISLMLGLRRPDTGIARIFGQDPRRAQARDRTGVMLQDSDVPATLRVREVVNLVGCYYPQPLSTDQALRMAGLADKADALASSLSGGQKKRLCFALSVVGNPDILFLDEPTAALDIGAQHSFRQQVSDFARLGKTIVMTTHNLEEADALAFASGLFISIDSLPSVVQNIAPFLPAYHGGMLARVAVGVPSASAQWVHAVWLLGFTAVFLALAVWAYRRDEGVNYR